MGNLTNKRQSAVYSKPLVINALRFFWICLVVWLEVGVFYWSLRSCHWPDSSIRTARRPQPTHVMLIADPQIIDHRSYPGRPEWAKTLTQFVVDSNLRKSWRAAKRLSPDIVIFLGDMMDGGRYRMLDQEYESYYARFTDIFKASKDIQNYYLVGNHDVGLGSNKAFSARARQRYLAHFGGATNYQVPVANHSFVFIDAPGLVEEDYVRYEQEEPFEDWAGMPGGTIEYVNRLTQEANPLPRILFSHIPLSRSAATDCGPLRERGSIQRGAGMGYQNLLGRHTSKYLIDSVKPLVIFSGDDHDYCEVHHPVGEDTDQKVREVSVKSFSMAMGIRRPGFQLLSLVAPDPSSPYSRTFSDTPCHLPDQMQIYTHVYAICGVLSIIVLAYLNAKQAKSKDRPTELGLLKVPQRGPGLPVLRSASLNVPSPRILRSRTVTPMGSPIIPSSPVLFAATGDDEDDISYPPSPNTAPMTPGSLFDLGAEDHTFSLPSPVMATEFQKSRWSRTKERKRPGWVEAKHRPWLSSLRNLSDLVGCSSLCSSSQKRGQTDNHVDVAYELVLRAFARDSVDFDFERGLPREWVQSESGDVRTFVAFIPPKPTPNRTPTKPLIIGFATAHISVHGLDIPPEITIINVAIDTLYRRRGIGENLIRAVTGSLLMSATAKRPAGGDALVSVQLRAKDSIVSYFEKLGWEKEDVRKGLTHW
ncbi:unnamed protein product, partial [Rhizoctonia solani]